MLLSSLPSQSTHAELSVFPLLSPGTRHPLHRTLQIVNTNRHARPCLPFTFHTRQRYHARTKHFPAFGHELQHSRALSTYAKISKIQTISARYLQRRQPIVHDSTSTAPSSFPVRGVSRVQVSHRSWPPPFHQQLHTTTTTTTTIAAAVAAAADVNTKCNGTMTVDLPTHSSCPHFPCRKLSQNSTSPTFNRTARFCFFRGFIFRFKRCNLKQNNAGRMKSDTR